MTKEETIPDTVARVLNEMYGTCMLANQVRPALETLKAEGILLMRVGVKDGDHMPPNPDEHDMHEYIQKLWQLDPVSEWDEVHGEDVLVSKIEDCRDGEATDARY